MIITISIAPTERIDSHMAQKTTSITLKGCKLDFNADFKVSSMSIQWKIGPRLSSRIHFSFHVTIRARYRPLGGIEENLALHHADFCSTRWIFEKIVFRVLWRHQFHWGFWNPSKSILIRIPFEFSGNLKSSSLISRIATRKFRYGNKFFAESDFCIIEWTFTDNPGEQSRLFDGWREKPFVSTVRNYRNLLAWIEQTDQGNLVRVNQGEQKKNLIGLRTWSVPPLSDRSERFVGPTNFDIALSSGWKRTVADTPVLTLSDEKFQSFIVDFILP